MDRDGTRLLCTPQGEQILDESQGMKAKLIQDKGASCSSLNPHWEGLDPAAPGSGIWGAQTPHFGAGGIAGGWGDGGGVEFVTSQGLVAGSNP